MTLQALRLLKKVEPSPGNREQESTLAVYGETGEVAMNDGRPNIFSVSLVAAGGRASITVV
ncbi:hypothetical protein RJJ65_08595 [Rhizobium hidalgonense]|uniref:Uncharacterized protein n=1 Tax=Rhizobium hidalgonense TaxID=1538159 RepID=A0A2A6K8H7_9HYPH|nr:hypothetical protein [Rhizobium hidalgonense]EJC78387.1 hypothetical protein Rleg10DRAFT_7121 [Rhizobium leguminosarum bv. trifolii WSM2012]MDR9772714.1 hypothetical protein [Rhizobium hidalgonense]MDR9814157.1 hypothetical protein [Rhizobium hidalgonense]MDR9820174.1 hypothetical protein [Rhizobium hidalgonense]PDT20858.1 hypothetical protein CO674_25775 [Rhizobium hidalgonense]